MANAPDGEPSAEATGIPLAPAPDQVGGVTVAPGVESLIVSWDPVAAASGYTVQWRSGDQEYGPEARQAHVDGAGTTSYTIPGLTPGTEYTVRVIATRAYAPDGEPSAEVSGVPGRRVDVSVADAAAVEGAAVEFPVRLTEPSVAAVTLTWITEGGGTAQAGEDYREVAAGRLTLPAGDVAGTLRVRTLDDTRVEPTETFRVRLTDATNADVDPRASSGTGTIMDDDAGPVRGRALGMVLAGTGRWVAADAVDVVEERFTPPAEGARVALGGQTLDLPAPGFVAGDGRDVHRDGLERSHAAVGRGEGLWTPPGVEPPSAAELLARSWFDLPLTPRDGAGAAGETPALRVWGRGSAGGFDGKPEAGLTMDGDLVGGYLGLDYRLRHDVLVGVALAHAQGDVEYAVESVMSGEVDLELTSVLPYAHFSPRTGLEVWGLLGAGRGGVELKDEAGRVETDLQMWMAAAGLQQDVATWREIDLALKADGFLTELKTDARAGLPKAAGSAKRVRVGLEGRRQWEISPVSRMTPSLEIGGRWDGGSAEQGLGMEVGGGLAYTHMDLGLEVEARGRVLLAHRASAFDEWGGSLTVKFDPGQAGRGPWMTFAPGWGAEGSRMAQMWGSREVFRAPGGAAGSPELSPDRLALDVGYGSAPGLLAPYAGWSITGPQARGYKMGARLEVDDRLDLGVEGRRSVRGNGRQGDEVMFFGRIEW